MSALPANRVWLVGGSGRVVDHDEDPLAFHVDAFVVVPFLLGCDDAVADEDHIALHLHLRALQSRKRHHVVVILVDTSGHAQGEAAIDSGFDDRHLLEVRAVFTGGLDADGHQLIGEIFRRERSAACRGRAPLEQIARQHLDVSFDEAWLNLVQCRTRAAGGLGGRTIWLAARSDQHDRCQAKRVCA